MSSREKEKAAKWPVIITILAFAALTFFLTKGCRAQDSISTKITQELSQRQPVYEVGTLDQKGKPKYFYTSDTAHVNKVVSRRLGTPINATGIICKTPPFVYIETPTQKIYVIRGRMKVKRNGKEKFVADKRIRSRY